MILLNTTFVLNMPPTCHAKFVMWLREVYVRSAILTGIFKAPLLTHIENPDPQAAESYALQMQAQNAEDARRWHDTTAQMLRNDMQRRWGDEAVFAFTTYLDIIPLED